MSHMTVIVTGAAGFIGSHVATCLLERGERVVGVDNMNDYYDPSLKRARLARLERLGGDFSLHEISVEDNEALTRAFDAAKPTKVVHLAAQAGVRYSIENPAAYVQSNLVGFGNILELSKRHQLQHLVYASSSSVYGNHTHMPFSVRDSVDHPMSLYAASKKANELMAHAYSHLFRLPTTGLRFFTVYGPWGRPDMALFLFTKAMLAGQPVPVFNHGVMSRDFTYIDDIVEGVIRTLDAPPQPDPSWNPEDPSPATSSAPYRVFNIGNGNPSELLDMIRLIEENLGLKATLNMLPMQPGDVPATYADVAELRDAVGFTPNTSLAIGIERFVRWYREYYAV
ncbi:MAG: NAD-dependent epimerase [Sandaracinaceae bacterium]|nr:NAD-dependent epimerase [Sandaracinaceae bacterium]